ncbi:MAG TPA: efflux transporter outer membrane subunit [Vicinamibacterales bacterium]|nr:efflux transporter outer membrane subunit [Vicinamibacterales bacterium]
MTRLRSRVPTVLVTLTCLGFVGCTVGPNYRRPLVDVPPAFRGEAPTPSSANTASEADESWTEVFTDEALQSLIRTALVQNADVRVAAARILEAQAQLGITRADQFPTVTAGVDVLGERPSVALGFPPENVLAFQLQGSLSWELDFWGRFRRATEGARAQLLASEWGRRAVVTTLVSQVADAYFGLRALDLELDIARRTLVSRDESLRLTQVREQGGATSLLDVRQAEQLVYGAKTEIANLERQIAQQENFIQVLLGQNPGSVDRGLPLGEQPHSPDVPVGLPSTLLVRRPDIQQSEYQLVAANAQIGVARAAYFPDIPLTGSGGFESTALTSLFAGSNLIWSAAVGATQPLFTAGRTRSQVALAKARYEEAVVSYQQTIRQAFREVADALVAYTKLRESRTQLVLLVASAQDARRLADIRYQGGATSYLEVLDADTRLFDAELTLAETQLSELSSFVEIYRALGGGWQP